MKRRNADCGKLRRPMKRNKITEGMYGSTTVLYMKFLILWAIVIVADFMFMFRFEFLWPFWLLLRSVHDSFKYKGLAFSVLFVCIAITSDLVCLFFIPVHWLLFAASTYVWVQYVWHTDKGICLPTIILWMLFVYFEVGIRWKNSRHIPHLDLCRPFAAHCIGYPVVTLGFGFKSYVGYRMRQRKQREVAKENEFYMQLLQRALPAEEHADGDVQAVLANGNATAVQATTNAIGASAGLSGSTASTVTTVHANGVLASQHQQQAHEQQQQHNHTHHHNNNNHSNNNSSNNHQNNSSINVGGAAASSSASSSSSTSTTTTTATSNGHAGGGGGGSKGHRRSVDKDRNKGGGSIGNNNSNNASDSASHDTKHNNSKNHNNNYAESSNNNNAKDKSTDWDSANYQQVQQTSGCGGSKETSQGSAAKEKQHHEKKSHGTANGNVLQLDIDEPVVVEHVVEKSKGRRNRSKKDNASKDNHHQSQQNQQHQNNNSNNQNHHTNNHNHNHKESSANATQSTTTSPNNDASSVSSSASSTTSSSTSTSSASAISNIASKVVSKICESCLKLEADVKKYRAEISHMKQIENELRQKLDSNLTTKSCLQAKQKECDELEKRIHELTNARHADMLNLQTVERRLNEERRQKQSLDAQLGNEKKARKLAEEKAARPECSSQCKQRKQQMEEELKRLRLELKQAEEAKQMAGEHARKFEQELRMLEAKVRTRDSTQPDAEVLMNALAAMQDKNSTLEKNLSAETRVKLDLFSALGVAKRQLEISENHRRSKEDEVIDLKAKIAQLLAVMPDTLCLNTGPGSSMMRMNDTPPLQTGPGPASPMLSSLSAAAGNQLNAHVQQVGGVGSPNAQSAQDYQQQQVQQQQVQHQQQQHQQHQQQQHQQHQQQQHQQQQLQQQHQQQQLQQQHQQQQLQQQHQQHQQQHQQQLQQQQQQHHQQQQQQHHQQQQQQQQQHVPVSVSGVVSSPAGSGGGGSTLDPNATVYKPNKNSADA